MCKFQFAQLTFSRLRSIINNNSVNWQRECRVSYSITKITKKKGWYQQWIKVKYQEC